MDILAKIDECNIVRGSLTDHIERLYNLDGQSETREFLSEFRKMPLEAIEKAKIVYSESREFISENVDIAMSDYLGFTYNGDNIFRERFIIPIPDIQGNICGMAGYDADSSIKYLFTNTMYFDKSCSFYNIDKYNSIMSKGYVIVIEGFFDSIRLSSIGFEENLALMGVRLSDYHVRVLNRIPLKILLGDGDEPGQNGMKFWSKSIGGKKAIIHIKPVEVTDLRTYINPDTDEEEQKEVATTTKDIDAICKFQPERVGEFKRLIKKIIKESESPFYTTKEYWF